MGKVMKKVLIVGAGGQGGLLKQRLPIMQRNL